jgi:hypothetical protein
MNTRAFFAFGTFVTLLAAAPVAAQEPLRGAEEGAAIGGAAAGPPGAIVGGTVGAAVGTAGAILGVQERPRFREYVVKERRPSFRYDRELEVGATLPEKGVTYYDVPSEYRVRPGYAYTIINERPVLVERRSRRVVEVLD